MNQVVISDQELAIMSGAEELTFSCWLNYKLKKACMIQGDPGRPLMTRRQRGETVIYQKDESGH